jgi:hypothetical protein
MLPPLRALLTAAAYVRCRYRRPLLLGVPYRATIAAAACDGYLLLISYTNGTEWLDLGHRAEAYDHPDEREFAAAADLLAARGLDWVLPWELDRQGNLTAPVTATAPTWKES